MTEILKYGSISFQLVELASYEEVLETIYSEQPSVATKPGLQHTGDGLKGVELLLKLSSGVGDVQAQAEAIEAVQVSKKAHSLVWADGRDLGEFVIASHRKRKVKTNSKGTPRYMEIVVRFKEYVEDNSKPPKLSRKGLPTRRLQSLQTPLSSRSNTALSQLAGVPSTDVRRATQQLGHQYGVPSSKAADALSANESRRPGTFRNMAAALSAGADVARSSGLKLPGTVSMAMPFVSRYGSGAGTRFNNTLSTMRQTPANNSLAYLGLSGGDPLTTTTLVAAKMTELTPAEQAQHKLAIYGNEEDADMLLNAGSDGSLAGNQSYVSNYKTPPIKSRVMMV